MNFLIRGNMLISRKSPKFLISIHLNGSRICAPPHHYTHIGLFTKVGSKQASEPTPAPEITNAPKAE